MYVLALFLIWLAMAALEARASVPTAEEVPGIAVLAAMAIVSAFVRDLPTGGTSISFTIVILLACIPLFGPLTAGVLGLVMALAPRARSSLIVPAFNAVMMGVMSLAGGAVYALLGGPHPLPAGLSPVGLVTRVGLPLLAADVVMVALNSLILAGMVAITGGKPRTVLLVGTRQLVPLYIGYVIIAFVFVLLWEPAGVGPLSALLIAAPLAIARFVYVQYGDEMRAHARILGLFTKVGDGPTGSVSAHARRVDQLCQLMAGQLALGEAERRALEYAAILHDVGMKGVVRETDTDRGGRGPYTNIRAILAHPVLAEEVISGIDFLSGAAATIRSHHERVDGRGYPDRLAGDAIPVTARVLAVADAFDALTTTRGDRAALSVPEALAELRASSGSQLDARIVEALAHVLNGRDWAPHEDPVAEGTWLWDHHALPGMSDVIADEFMEATPALRRAEDAVER